MAREFVRTSTQYLETLTEVLSSAFPHSVSFWIYPRQDTTNQWIYAIGDMDAGDNYFAAYIRGADAGDPMRCVKRDPVTGPVGAITGNGYTIDTWHHVAIVHASSTSQKICLDGDLANEGENTTDISPSVFEMRIGWSHGSPGDGADICFAEFAIWDAVLSDGEKVALASGVRPLFVRPQSLTGYWPLIGRNSPEVDLIGKNNLTLVNAPTAFSHSPTTHVWSPTIFTPNPVNHYAGMGWRNQHPTMRFNDSSREYSIYTSRMPSNYGGNGIELNLHYSMATATSGNVKWGAAFERIGDESQDVDERGFADFNYRDQEVSGTSGYVKVAKIRFIDGADMDSVGAGDQFRLKIVRDGFVDGATGDAELHHIEIQELA